MYNLAMDPEQNRAFASVLKLQHDIMQALEDQSRQIEAIRKTLEHIRDELPLSPRERED